MMPPSVDESFQKDADKYATYLETPEGRLRLDLAFANVEELLPQAKPTLLALDLGGGTGALAVRLARLGFRVTLLDPSLPMLEYAKRAAQEAGVADRVSLTRGDAAELSGLFDAGSLDLILCHNVLEFLVDPGAVLRCVTRALSDSGLISILVRNRPGEVLKSALLNGDLAAAENGLAAEWGEESLYGGRVRLFTAESLRVMLEEASLEVIAERGVRVVSDYLPSTISRVDEYGRIFDLERKLGSRPEFSAVARYAQCLARRTQP